MNKEKRHQTIVEMISIEGKVNIIDLSSKLNVSEDTVRRDLVELENQKMLKRIRSGAVRIGPAVTSFEYRCSVNTHVKRLISKKILPYISQHKTILIDGSTSNLELVKLLPPNFNATFVTNCPPIATELAKLESSEIIVVGGKLYKKPMINVGASTFEIIRNMNFDIFINGIYHVDSTLGTSVPTFEEANIKRLMMERSESIFSIVTSDKFETISNFIIDSDIRNLNIFTHDLSKEIFQKYKSKGINIYQ
ncbi:DeoR/GlpR family DNA-binding transcription regulator [Falseniella ignava]|uniref:Lactose phosphotransferase system repressor n=1 Tax=Falseniella ignava CCUG 37419 TaxID=883112 RepID=K1LMD1_9LACT|nr:DeoR/GlpR family DNA-binding transcription regulator [Falseniella ignava]EKB55786.1 hypothetical protein HMPREF9707_00973 [Falseniella ignava CCUG 37419]